MGQSGAAAHRRVRYPLSREGGPTGNTLRQFGLVVNYLSFIALRRQQRSEKLLCIGPRIVLLNAQFGLAGFSSRISLSYRFDQVS